MNFFSSSKFNLHFLHYSFISFNLEDFSSGKIRYVVERKIHRLGVMQTHFNSCVTYKTDLNSEWYFFSSVDSKIHLISFYEE